MSTQNNKAEKHLEKEMVENDEQIATLSSLLLKAKKRKVQLKKAHRVLVGDSSRDESGIVAPNLKHVGRGIQKAFEGVERLTLDQLEVQVLKILKAQNGLSEQGLTLRVKQGLAKLKVDSDGFVDSSSVGDLPNQ